MEILTILEILPDELWVNITEYLDYICIINLSGICKKLYKIIHSINYCNQKLPGLNNKYLIFNNNFDNTFLKNLYLIKTFWTNIPIYMILTEYHINILNLRNIFKNYINNILNITKINISLINTRLNYLYIDLYNCINDIPKSIKSINYYYNNTQPLLPIHNVQSFNFQDNISELTLDLKNILDLNLFKINYKKLLRLELNNVLFNDDIMTNELKTNLSNIKELVIYNNITDYDISFLKNNEKISLYNTYFNQETINNFKNCKQVFIDFSSIIYETKQAELQSLNIKPLQNVNKLTIMIIKYSKFIDFTLLNNVQYLNLDSNLNIGFSIPYYMNCTTLILNNTYIQNADLQYFKYVERLSISNCYYIDNLDGLKISSIKILNISFNQRIKYIDFLTYLDVLMICSCSQELEMRNHLHKFKISNTTLIKNYDDYLNYITLFNF